MIMDTGILLMAVWQKQPSEIAHALRGQFKGGQTLHQPTFAFPRHRHTSVSILVHFGFTSVCAKLSPGVQEEGTQ